METICIPRQRYEYLLKCERVIDMQFEEKVSKEFIMDVKKSEEAYKKGEYIEVNSKKERKRLFNSL